MENIYLDFGRIMNYSAMLKIIIGERGVGKTYGAKDYTIKHYRSKKKRFVWLRRNATDLEEAIGKPNMPTFYQPLQEKYPNWKFEVEEGKKRKNILVNGIVYGYGMSLRQAESIKGTEYNDVDTIILDEFLVGDGGGHYLRNEPMYLLSIIETIARLRPVNIILLGNATSVSNPYFDFFNLSLPYNTEFKTFKNNSIVVWYVKNEIYRQKKKESNFGQLVSETAYEKYAIDNEFINDSNNFIRKRTPNSKIFFNLILNIKTYGVWIENDKMYISTKFNIHHNVIFTYDINSHTEKTILMRKSNVYMKQLINYYQIGNLFFENQNIKHEVIDLLRKLHLIY